MIRIFDLYLIRIFVRAFVICFTSLVGLYTVIDAFSNLDEFSERSHGVLELLSTMGEYYSYRVCWFFDQLAGIITTLAAMFTFSWVRRTNELMPMLSAGVPIYRLIAPVLIAAMAVSGLMAANQELLIPRVAARLQMAPDDDAVRSVAAHPTYDARGILLGGSRCYRQDQTIKPAWVSLPHRLTGTPVVLRSTEARYVPPSGEPLSGGWILNGTSPDEVQCSDTILEPLGPGSYFLHTTLTFEQISRPNRWFQFSSTRELLAEMADPANNLRTEMAVLLHTRFTRPIVTLTLLLLGLPFVLSGTDRRMVSLVGMSLAVCLSFQMFAQLCLRLGHADCLAPALAAWLPVLVFGSVAIGMLDLVKT